MNKILINIYKIKIIPINPTKTNKLKNDECGKTKPDVIMSLLKL